MLPAAGDSLDAEAARVVAEEEALLERVKEAIEAARERRAARAPDEDPLDRLRALRDEAAITQREDLPNLLHEFRIRRRLADRRLGEPLPDPRSPYLAHLRLEEGGRESDYLLGHVSFFDGAREIAIVDWRVAPIARVFYRYREGDLFEERFPGRLAEGRVAARRIVAIEDGRLTRVLAAGAQLERDRDGRWRRAGELVFARGGTGRAARAGVLGVGVGAEGRAAAADVTALLDPEQYAAVTAPAERPLLVLGSAGSGKTTVALHRLARTTEAESRTYPLARSAVLVPEEGLARLSRRLLEPLGIGGTRVQTTEEWLVGLARRTFGRTLRVCLEAPPLVAELKRHPATLALVGPRLAEGAPFEDLRRGLGEAFTDEDLLGRILAAAGGDLPRTAIEETRRHTRLQLAAPTSEKLADLTDPERARAVDGASIDEGTPEALAGTVDLEDLPLLLGKLDRIAGAPLSLAVLDEAEDFSLAELELLRRLLDDGASLTLAGDEAQQTASSFAGWGAALAALGAEAAEVCRLPISYRCPGPVAELARRILGPLAPAGGPEVARQGAPVGIFRMPSESQAHLFLASALVDLLEREPRAAVGVIAADAGAARRFHELVAEHPEARLVLGGEFSFEAGIDVAPVEDAKGLEWDYVIVPDATAAAYPASDDARRRLHVAVTRAAHQVWLVAGGAPSPLLAGE